jgi:hypothetical protein
MSGRGAGVPPRCPPVQVFSVIPLARSNFVSLALNFINRQPRGSGTGPALTGVIDQGRGSKVWGSR